jgi:hypothetical protein
MLKCFIQIVVINNLGESSTSPAMMLWDCLVSTSNTSASEVTLSGGSGGVAEEKGGTNEILIGPTYTSSKEGS